MFHNFIQRCVKGKSSHRDRCLVANVQCNSLCSCCKIKNENGYLDNIKWHWRGSSFANKKIDLDFISHRNFLIPTSYFCFMRCFSNLPWSTLTVSIVVVTRRKRTSTPFDGMYSLIFISSLTPPTDNSQCCSAPALTPSNEISSKFPLLLSSHWNLKMNV